MAINAQNAGRRVRAPNFSEREVETMIQLVRADPDLRDGKIGGTYKTPREVTNAWSQIAQIVSSVGEGYVRTPTDLRNKWKALKSITKKKSEKKRKEIKQVGTGTVFMSRRENEVMEILSESVPTGDDDGGTDTNDPGASRLAFGADETNPAVVATNGVQSLVSSLTENFPPVASSVYIPQQPMSFKTIVQPPPVLPPKEPSINMPKPTSTARVRLSRWRKRIREKQEEEDNVKKLIISHSDLVGHIKEMRTDISDIKLSMAEIAAQLKRANSLKESELQLKARKYGMEVNYGYNY